MKRTVFAFAFFITGAVACAGCYCNDDWWYEYQPGPELTQNYSATYLQACGYERAYADPMYYYATGSTGRWKARQNYLARLEEIKAKEDALAKKAAEKARQAELAGIAEQPNKAEGKQAEQPGKAEQPKEPQKAAQPKKPVNQ